LSSFTVKADWKAAVDALQQRAMFVHCPKSVIAGIKKIVKGPLIV